MKKNEILCIQNPIIRRALQKRCSEFMFNYGDHSEEHSDADHVDKSFREYNDAWKKYTDHEDYTKLHSEYDAYSDFPHHDYWDQP